MGKTQLALVQVNRQFLLAPLLLSLLVQLYRWWLQLRRRQKCSSSAAPSAAGSQVSSPSRGSTPDRSGFSGKLCPPPRPGVDDDERMDKINDDPRYFQGAEIGKAQKAAMGQTFDSGTNTVSFDPASTLVRPSMRILHGIHGDRHRAPVKPEDVIIVPDFACSEEDHGLYWTLVDEIREVGLAGGEDPRKLPSVAQMASRLCTYFGLVEKECSASLAWHREKQDAAVFQGRAASSAHFGSAVSVCLGAAGAFVFEPSSPQGVLHLPCWNGNAVLASRDVELQWQPHASGQRTHGSCPGQLLLTLSGPSELLAEEKLLAPKRIAASGAYRSPPSGFARPSMRIITVPPSLRYSGTVSHDDVIIVPGFFCAEDDMDIYYKLLKDMRENQANGERNSEWQSWHEGSHLLTKNPTGSRTFQEILDRLREYFAIVPNGELATRFNWYRDGSDWKPFHHDSAAFNAQRAMAQNCTVGISFGASRELAFRDAKSGELVYFPQTNGMLFFFGRDANIRWQHGINALPVEEQDGKGRISIILWGLSSKAIEEEGSPPMISHDKPGFSRAPNGRPVGANYRTQVCRNFQQRGTCSYGDRCRFQHIPGSNGRTF